MTNSALRVLYVGGTGEISQACVDASLAAGHEVTTFNRGNQNSTGHQVECVTGSLLDAAPYCALADKEFGVVCQFLAFDTQQVRKDIEFFKDRCGQYIFISTASAYQKPHPGGVITEQTKLDNPFWEYSQKKIECEVALRRLCADANLAFTIVRPSHTFRTRMPGAVIDGDHQSWRMLKGKPVIVHGDGQSLWTLTYATDFAQAFTRLFGNPKALNQDFQITKDHAHTWDSIVQTSAQIIGCAANIVHVTPEALIRDRDAWYGPLLGDKANCVEFSKEKLVDAIGDWSCAISLEHGISLAWQFAQQRITNDYRPDESLDALVDKIISSQN